jgi:hypothetical protein
MCSNDDRADLGSRMNVGTLSRRSILFGSTAFAAASALGAGAPLGLAHAQAPSTQAKPNILFTSSTKMVGEFEASVKKYPLIAMGTPDPYTPPH